MVLHRRQQRPRLIAIQCHPISRGGDPKRLHGSHGVPSERAHLHRLVHGLRQGLTVVPHCPRRQLPGERRLPLESQRTDLYAFAGERDSSGSGNSADTTSVVRAQHVELPLSAHNHVTP